MNIKIVYNNKIHKLAQSQFTYESVRAGIKKIYADKLSDDFKIFFSANPSTDELVKIENEEQMTFAKQHYAQQNWTSLKLLIMEKDKENVDKKDLDLLNQSFVAGSRFATQPQPQQQEKKQSQQDIKDTQSQTQFETEKKSVQTEKLSTQDACSMSQPQQTDYQQQFQPVSQSQSCQFSIPMKDNGQNPVIQEIDPKVYKVLNELLKSDVDLKKLVDTINLLIDNRLQYHQLIEAQKKDDQPQKQQQQEEKKNQENQNKNVPPQMHVRSVARILYELKQNEEFEWHVIVKNKGPNAWPDNVGIECLQGPYEGKQQLVGFSLKPDEEHKILMKFKTDIDFGIYDLDFRLFYVVDGQKRYFGQKINFKLTVQKQEKEVKNQIQCSSAQPTVVKSSNVLEKAKELKTIFPEASIKELVEFINLAGAGVQIDELVEIYLQNKA